MGRQWDLAWGADGELAAIDSTDLVWDRADGLAVPVSAETLTISLAYPASRAKNYGITRKYGIILHEVNIIK